MSVVAKLRAFGFRQLNSNTYTNGVTTIQRLHSSWIIKTDDKELEFHRFNTLYSYLCEKENKCYSA